VKGAQGDVLFTLFRGVGVRRGERPARVQEVTAHVALGAPCVVPLERGEDAPVVLQRMVKLFGSSAKTALARRRRRSPRPRRWTAGTSTNQMIAPTRILVNTALPVPPIALSIAVTSAT
jgi:hypothetical protein